MQFDGLHGRTLVSQIGKVWVAIFLGIKFTFATIKGGGEKKCCLGIQTRYRAKSEGPIFSLKMDNPQRWQIKALKNGLDLLHILWALHEPKAMVYV
jgi:hypothetical protein